MRLDRKFLVIGISTLVFGLFSSWAHVQAGPEESDAERRARDLANGLYSNYGGKKAVNDLIARDLANGEVIHFPERFVENLYKAYQREEHPMSRNVMITLIAAFEAGHSPSPELALEMIEDAEGNPELRSNYSDGLLGYLYQFTRSEKIIDLLENDVFSHLSYETDGWMPFESLRVMVSRTCRATDILIIGLRQSPPPETMAPAWWYDMYYVSNKGFLVYALEEVDWERYALYRCLGGDPVATLEKVIATVDQSLTNLSNTNFEEVSTRDERELRAALVSLKQKVARALEKIDR